MMPYWLEDVLFFGLLALFLTGMPAGIIGGAILIDRAHCYRSASDLGPIEWGILSGCRVEIDGKPHTHSHASVQPRRQTGD